MSGLFGTDGIRGKAGEYPVIAEVAERLGRAVVEVLGKGNGAKVLVGRDTRESGPLLEAGLVKGLMSRGAEVVRLGVVPTPALASVVAGMGADAAVMITASHNPFSDNGMKVFGAGGHKLDEAVEKRIEKILLEDGGEGVGGGEVRDFPEGIESYVRTTAASIDGLDLKGLKIVLDAGNGSGFAIAPKIFRDLGAEVIAMAVEPDGRNINENCGAVHADVAGRLVKEHGADLGISLDGDADRVIFTTADGLVLSGDRVLAIGALGLKSRGRLRKNTMVATVMSNLGLDEAMRKHGITVLRSGVGDRQVLEMMKAENLSFGGENSGHLIFSDHATTGDGIMSALQVCRLMREENKTLAELASVMDEYPSTLLNLPVREKVAIEKLPRLMAMIAEAEEAFGADGRQLIRYSGTESKIRVLVEHKDAAVVAEWIGKFKEVIREELG
jgi:phosphoglucosamine mutase